MPAPASQSSWLSSCQPLVKRVRRASAAGASTSPAINWRAPSTACASSSADAGRSSPFDGMHA
jgi:hypothetical protein